MPPTGADLVRAKITRLLNYPNDDLGLGVGIGLAATDKGDAIYYKPSSLDRTYKITVELVNDLPPEPDY